MCYIYVNITQHCLYMQMTYIKSASGFYFVYDFCLLENLPPLASYALRYLPSVVAFIVLFFIRTVRYTALKVSLLILHHKKLLLHAIGNYSVRGSHFNIMAVG